MRLTLDHLFHRKQRRTGPGRYITGYNRLHRSLQSLRTPLPTFVNSVTFCKGFPSPADSACCGGAVITLDEVGFAWICLETRCNSRQATPPSPDREWSPLAAAWNSKGPPKLATPASHRASLPI